MLQAVGGFCLAIVMVMCLRNRNVSELIVERGGGVLNV